jgi:cell division protein FtsX
MSSLKEAEARYITSIQEEMEQMDRAEVEARIRNGYEVSKIEALSKECRRFLDSPIGRFIQKEALDHAEAALDRLVKLKMADFQSKDHFLDAVKDLQYEADVPLKIITFLNNAILKAREETTIFEENL